MSAYDIAKDAVRLASTATLSKDVIDLLQAKLSLLSDQVALLEKDNASLRAENANLKAQLDHLQPPGDSFADPAVQILKLFFDAGKRLSMEQVAAHLKIQKVVVEHHFDTLLKRKFLRQATVGFEDHSGYFELLPDGRAYAVRKFS